MPQPTGLYRVLEFISLLTSGEANVFWAAVIATVWFRRGQKDKAAFLFLGTALGSILSPLLKNVFRRPRPLLPDQLETWSFPSGHALSITVFSLLLAWLYARAKPERRLCYYALAAMIIALVSFSRVYLGVHYVTDVIGGCLIGLAFVGGWVRWRGAFSGFSQR
jgi:undecaprenyl-diphosphatase